MRFERVILILRLGIFSVMIGAAALLGACVRDAPQATPTPFPTLSGDLLPTPTDFLPPTPTGTPPPIPWTDENAVMSGICFEAAHDAAGRVFVLRGANDLTTLFDLADNSRLCRRPVERGVFDFANGRVLVGLWNRGLGCTARHEVTDVRRDDAARVLMLSVRMISEGNCGYELVRPFWIGLSGFEGYEIIVTQG